jgi:hypothetical protein
MAFTEDRVWSSFDTTESGDVALLISIVGGRLPFSSSLVVLAQ